MKSLLFVSIFLLTSCGALSAHVDRKAIYGIGMRIAMDQLLLRDVLPARSGGLDESPRVSFNYAIPQPITYIEISAAENVQAEVNFSYYNDLVEGTITAIDSEAQEMQPFDVLITIYGFNDTMLNVNPAYIINKDQQFKGILERSYMDREYRNLIAEENFGEEDDDVYANSAFFTTPAAAAIDDDEGENENEDDENDDVHANDDADDDDDYDFGNKDKIIEVGVRQVGDSLLFDTYQTSAAPTAKPTNHSVIFYYVDSDYITNVKFTIYDHDVDANAPDYQPPVAEYSHFSPVTLKAVITDFNTTSILVRMQLYGYKASEIPTDYKFFFSNLRSIEDVTDVPVSALHNLKMHLNALPLDTNEIQSQHIAMAAPENETVNDAASKPPQTSIFWSAVAAAMLSYLTVFARQQM